jgi:hypothetical protein
MSHIKLIFVKSKLQNFSNITVVCLSSLKNLTIKKFTIIIIIHHIITHTHFYNFDKINNFLLYYFYILNLQTLNHTTQGMSHIILIVVILCLNHITGISNLFFFLILIFLSPNSMQFRCNMVQYC